MHRFSPLNYFCLNFLLCRFLDRCLHTLCFDLCEDTLCTGGIYSKTYTDVNGLLCLCDVTFSMAMTNYPPMVSGNIEYKFVGPYAAILMVSGDGTITLSQ